MAWGWLSSVGMLLPPLMGMEQGFPWACSWLDFSWPPGHGWLSHGKQWGGEKDLVVLLSSWSFGFVLSCFCFPSQEAPGMETLYPSPGMGSASCPLPKATAGADGASSILPLFSQEDVESLSDEAPAPGTHWLVYIPRLGIQRE